MPLYSTPRHPQQNRRAIAMRFAPCQFPLSTSSSARSCASAIRLERLAMPRAHMSTAREHRTVRLTRHRRLNRHPRHEGHEMLQHHMSIIVSATTVIQPHWFQLTIIYNLATPICTTPRPLSTIRPPQTAQHGAPLAVYTLSCPYLVFGCTWHLLN